MPVYAPQPEPFDCVLCGTRRFPSRWGIGAQVDYPPLCWRCEQYGWRQGPVTTNPDRRLVKQVLVLADALSGEAHHQIYRWCDGGA